MKPRLRYSRNVWSCRMDNFLLTGVIGYGYSPSDAYSNWLSERRRLSNCRLRLS